MQIIRAYIILLESLVGMQCFSTSVKQCNFYQSEAYYASEISGFFSINNVQYTFQKTNSEILTIDFKLAIYGSIHLLICLWVSVIHISFILDVHQKIRLVS